jgi:hypothetical protein
MIQNNDELIIETPEFTFMGLKVKAKKTDEPETFIPPITDDGSFISIATGTHQIAYHRDFSGYDHTDISRIRRYREIAQYPECEQAISEIVNEAIISDDEEDPVELIIDDKAIPKKLQKLIHNEFDYICHLFDFQLDGHDIFRDWYIDGRLVYHVITNSAQNRIIELRKIDPCNIRKIKEVEEIVDQKTSITTFKVKREYFIYQESTQTVKGRSSSVINREVEIHKDAILFVPSGLLDEERKNVISYLHRSIKTVNQLRMLEDSQIVYRLVRAPERRVFYIDVGNLPTNKAEAYLQSVISKFRNKIVYDGVTGEIKDARQQIAMVEDFWLPRRCLDLQTEILLLDNKTKTLAELIEDYNAGIENYTYSVSPNGDIVPGLISWAGITQENADVIELTLDNGKTIICTPDHKFVLRDGSKKKAEELLGDDSLMPCYFDDEKILDNFSGEWVDPSEIKNKSLFIVYKTTNKINGRFYIGKHKQTSLEFDGYLGSGTLISKAIEKYGKENFERETLYYSYNEEEAFEFEKEEINKYHGLKECYNLSTGGCLGASGAIRTLEYREKMSASLTSRKKTNNHKKKLSESGKEFFKSSAGNQRKLEISEFSRSSSAVLEGAARGRDKISTQYNIDKEILSDEEFDKKYRSRGRKAHEVRKTFLIENGEVAYREKYCKTSKEDLLKRGKNGAESRKAKCREKYSIVDLEEMIDVIRVVIVENPNASNKDIIDILSEKYPVLNTYKRVHQFIQKFTNYNSLSDLIMKCFGADYLSTRRQFFNHKIINIRKLDKKVTVGTLTIDENHIHHDFHNFALAAGVFVMNSGGSGTDVQTLAGQTNQGAQEDLEYFQKKLFRSLNVPLQRLAQETGFSIGRASEITREEVKFSKLIGRLRRKFSSLLIQALRIQLRLKKIVTESEWENDILPALKIDFRRDNYYAELKESEILRERLGLLNEIEPLIGKYFSKEWVRTSILRQSQQDIVEIDKQIQKEKDAGEYDEDGDEGYGDEQEPADSGETDTDFPDNSEPPENEPDPEVEEEKDENYLWEKQ